MEKIFQTITDEKTGDCMRAAVASLLDLKDINMVPHFGLYDIKGNTQTWWDVFFYFFYAFGYEYCGNAHWETREAVFEDSINGVFYVSVPSLNYKKATHAVVMNMEYVCVHDPNNSGYLGKNIKECLNYWYMFKKIK